MTIYDFKVKDYKGNLVDLNDYKNKVILVVNTATKCGFTKQYDGLEALYKKYHEKGFEILDFPCNQFLAQAPGTGEQIHDACILRFMIEFPQFEKIKVNGKDEHPLYTYLKENAPKGKNGKIKWNFTKFLIDKNGNIVDRFEPPITPEQIDQHIQKLL